MNKAITTLLLLLAAWLALSAETVTIEQCVEKAEENYPLIRKYDLLAAACDIELSDIDKAWLPQIGISGQVTAQNAVPSYPETLSHFLDQAGQKIEGLGKVQYKAGVDVAQSIWDGGVARSRRRVQKAGTEVQKEALEVEIYAVRQRVENLYFAILLAEEQVKISENTLALVRSNLDRLRSMLKNGTAMQSDVDMLEAQALTIEQGRTQAQSAVKGYRKMLGIFAGFDMQDCELAIPVAAVPSALESNRPELRLFENKKALIDASQRLSDTSLMPKVGLFAQAYYGYPGFNYFKSMMERDMSLNLMAGLKVSWNIDSFYTKKNAKRRNDIDSQGVAVDKDVFLFNTNMQSASAMESIAGLREVMAKDEQIVALRQRVRQAAESQLDNGVIDATALLTKINDENQAELTARYHAIQLLQEIYNLKYILNR